MMKVINCFEQFLIYFSNGSNQKKMYHFQCMFYCFFLIKTLKSSLSDSNEIPLKGQENREMLGEDSCC